MLRRTCIWINKHKIHRSVRNCKISTTKNNHVYFNRHFPGERWPGFTNFPFGLLPPESATNLSRQMAQVFTSQMSFLSPKQGQSRGYSKHWTTARESHLPPSPFIRPQPDSRKKGGCSPCASTLTIRKTTNIRERLDSKLETGTKYCTNQYWHLRTFNGMICRHWSSCFAKLQISSEKPYHELYFTMLNILWKFCTWRPSEAYGGKPIHLNCSAWQTEKGCLLTVKSMKYFWLCSPMQLLTHGQWWSIFRIQRRQTLKYHTTL